MIGQTSAKTEITIILKMIVLFKKKFILKFYSLNKDTTPPPNTLYYCRFLEFKWDRIKTGREIYWLNRNRPKDSLSE